MTDIEPTDEPIEQQIRKKAVAYSDTMGLTREGAIRRLGVLVDMAFVAADTIAAAEAREAWRAIDTFNEPTGMSSGNGVLVACENGEVGEAYFRNFGDDSDGWWWANTSWGDYPDPERPTPIFWRPMPDAPLAALGEQPFQSRVDNWMALTFSPEVRADKIERAMRFLEEATELCQAIGLPREKAVVVTDYVFGRPVGEPWQEVGGSMVTLAALCAAIEQDMASCGERELARIDTPEMREKIAAKQLSKRLFGMVGESTEARAALGEQP